MNNKNARIFLVFALIIVGFCAFFASSSATQLVGNIQKDAPAINTKDPAMQAGFIPHKALYDIKLAGKKSGSQIVNIKGQMFYDWSSGCEGWNSNHRFNLLYEYADTPPMKITSDFSTYETFDGKTFNFASQRKRNGELFEELRGMAVLFDKAPKASYSMPEGLEYDLDPHTRFPMRHTMDVLKKIKEGEKFYKARIFDGSDEDGPIEINAFIGKPAKVLSSFKDNNNVDTALLDNQAWKVQLAFFPLNSDQSVADYEMTLTFHENGIISDMLVDYSDFTVSQKLVAVEAISKEPCMDLKATTMQ